MYHVRERASGELYAAFWTDDYRWNLKQQDEAVRQTLAGAEDLQQINPSSSDEDPVYPEEELTSSPEDALEPTETFRVSRIAEALRSRFVVVEADEPEEPEV